METKPTTLRTFVAIELPETRAYLAEVQRVLQQAPVAADLRFVSPGSIHLTLQFLGDIPEAQVPATTEALQSALKGSREFLLTLGNLGWFPARGPLRVLWWGLEGDLEALKRLQKAVEDTLVPLGFRPERGFSPHLTLARARQGRRVNSRDFESAPLPSAESHAKNIPVGAITLMRSDLLPQGAVYTPLWKGRVEHVCPVCGYPGLEVEAYDLVFDLASFEICPCCRFQYGATEEAGRSTSITRWRERWIADGMRWWFGNPPDGWNPRGQLRNIGVELPPE